MISSITVLRDTIRSFVEERKWQQFHTPKNLSLALAGECGELCEIFQWKATVDFTVMEEKDIVHLGEELSDVFIYNCRLADLSKVNLCSAIRNATLHGSEENTLRNDAWDDISMDDLQTLSKLEVVTSADDVRDVVLIVSRTVGRISGLFVNKTKSACDDGLADWKHEDVVVLSQLVAEVALCVARIATLANISLAQCITDKIRKNNAKYPAHLVTGSSAKYTAYADKIPSASS